MGELIERLQKTVEQMEFEAKAKAWAEANGYQKVSPTDSEPKPHYPGGLVHA